MNNPKSAIQISISTPYRENAIVNIARSAAQSQNLSCFYTPLFFGRWQLFAGRLPFVGQWLQSELGRRSFSGVPAAKIVNAAAVPELLHVLGKRLLGRHWPSLVVGMMYWVKMRFDLSVARHLRNERPEAFVGMFGASLESFRVVKSYGGLAVLNFVNSHPIEHNYYLRRLAGLKEPHPEFVPVWIVSRVIKEVEISDTILVPSEFVKHQLTGHGVPADKIVTLQYGVDLGAFYPDEGKAKKDQKILDCLFVGQISHRKGIRTLFEAARRCRHLPVRFSLVGPIVSAELLAELPENVVYAGASLPGGVPAAMRGADIFVLPTLEDSFALVVLEAMATGLAVISTTNAGVSEMLEDGVDGLIVPSGDASALADAIVRLVDDPSLRAQLGQAARTKILETHSWDVYGLSVLKAIEVRCQRVT